MRAVAVLALALLALSGCVDKAAEAKKKADQQKAFMDAEAKAQAAEDAKEAQAAYDAANNGCNGGDAAKCVDLGKLQAKEPAKAVQSFAKACALKSKDGCRQAAIAETNGKNRLGYLESLCDLGDVDGCIEGAKIADGVSPEPKKPAQRESMNLLKKACGFGQAIACTARGVGLVNDDPQGAVESFTKGCDAGEPTSCKTLGDMVKEGKGVKKKDEKRAKELYKKACDAGLKEAC